MNLRLPANIHTTRQAKSEWLRAKGQMLYLHPTVCMALIVRSSPLHGAGVYTTAPIKSGERVLEYTGPRLTKKQTEGMYADSEVTYLFGLQDGKTVIDGFG